MRPGGLLWKLPSHCLGGDYLDVHFIDCMFWGIIQRVPFSALLEKTDPCWKWLQRFNLWYHDVCVFVHTVRPQKHSFFFFKSLLFPVLWFFFSLADRFTSFVLSSFLTCCYPSQLPQVFLWGWLSFTVKKKKKNQYTSAYQNVSFSSGSSQPRLSPPGVYEL